MHLSGSLSLTFPLTLALPLFLSFSSRQVASFPFLFDKFKQLPLSACCKPAAADTSRCWLNFHFHSLVITSRAFARLGQSSMPPPIWRPAALCGQQLFPLCSLRRAWRLKLIRSQRQQVLLARDYNHHRRPQQHQFAELAG